MTGKMHYFVNKHYLLGMIRMDTGGKISYIRVKIDVVRDRRANGQHQAIRRRRGNHSKTVRELDIECKKKAGPVRLTSNRDFDKYRSLDILKIEPFWHNEPTRNMALNRMASRSCLYGLACSRESG